VRRANGYRHIVAYMCIVVRAVWGVEAYHAFRDEEGLIVHFVPVGWRANCVRWERELCGPDAVVWHSSAPTQQGRIRSVLPVCDPSSMILQVMCPSFRISPDVEGTNVTGRRGIFIVASACLASSSMMTSM
jgi:hypothetical protein